VSVTFASIEAEAQKRIAIAIAVQLVHDVRKEYLPCLRMDGWIPCQACLQGLRRIRGRCRNKWIINYVAGVDSFLPWLIRCLNHLSLKSVALELDLEGSSQVREAFKLTTSLTPQPVLGYPPTFVAYCRLHSYVLYTSCVSVNLLSLRHRLPGIELAIPFRGAPWVRLLPSETLRTSTDLPIPRSSSNQRTNVQRRIFA
jgi:hypothetical protein